MPGSEDVKTDAKQDARKRFGALEKAVERLLERLGAAEARASDAEARRDEVEGLLREMSDGSTDPAAMAGRLDELERENADLRSRVDRGREGVERMLSRVRFLEDQR